MAPTLRTQLLGGFRVLLDQQDISTSFSERVKLLFAYLLLNSETAIARKHLAFTFWPDSTESQARTNLRNLLHHLRNTLRVSEPFVEVDTKSIQWKGNAHTQLDVHRFAKAISAAESSDDVRDRISHLQEAVYHYRGELLPDLYEDWLLKHREELHQSFITAILLVGTFRVTFFSRCVIALMLKQMPWNLGREVRLS
jgi:DNA-binding SARP family transcriptional activator